MAAQGTFFDILIYLRIVVTNRTSRNSLVISYTHTHTHTEREIDFFLTERECMHEQSKGRERGRERIPSRLHT